MSRLLAALSLVVFATLAGCAASTEVEQDDLAEPTAPAEGDLAAQSEQCRTRRTNCTACARGRRTCTTIYECRASSSRPYWPVSQCRSSHNC
jgi:hypothetical protein